MDWEAQRTSFGQVAIAYDAHRPEWPAATAAWLTGTESAGTESAGTESAGTESAGTETIAAGAVVGRPPLAAKQPLDVLDLGAGTGKLTRSLVAAGHRVTAADPSIGMLAVLAASMPQVRTVLASAERLPLPDASVDVITVAQAWHWVNAEAAAAECARVLRPGGLLAIAWHLWAVTAEPWMMQLQSLVARSQYEAREEIRVRTSLTLPEPFSELERTTFDYGLELTPAGLAAVASTWSYVATRDDRGSVLAEVEALGQRVAGADGRLVLPYVTYCYRAQR